MRTQSALLSPTLTFGGNAGLEPSAPLPTWLFHPIHRCGVGGGWGVGEGSPNIAKSSDSTVRRCARTRPAGSYPELLFANWRSAQVCDDKTWKPKPKQNKNQNKTEIPK